ncbi:MAG: glutamine--tRNA ligase, partial [Paludibacteraceae bacterium]|nr:glutamine--tRNA ligase [Paludibacteraceae bacterium]
MEEVQEKSLNFIEQIVEKDLQEGKNDGRIQTRFPPEPNGYLHIGHVKAICMDFGIAEKYNGVCNLRFDDTNPVKEDTEYVDSIQQDIAWLGFRWGNVYYASDYFQKLYDLAIRFIKEGKAYVDEQSAEQIAEQKGTPTEAGKESPFRNRPIDENLRLFQAMQNGEIEDGKMVLRAKIDMANPNMHFRDPIMYRIITTHPHHRTGRRWNVYPMYDFAHGQSDYFEGVTHSICTLEFVVHRPLYDYFIDQFADSDYRPHQYEFNRLNITYTVMSKRKMLQLVKEGLVAGWDDPRMPTVCGLRRRGYTAEAIREFINKIGYTKVEGMIDLGLLEHTIRESLKETASRVCAIFDPVKLVLTNYEGEGETIVAENIDGHSELGTREMQFARELYIERGDFLENADKNFFRLSPGGREVRLKSAYIIQATGCEKDENGNITTVYATYDPTSKSGTEGGN